MNDRVEFVRAGIELYNSAIHWYGKIKGYYAGKKYYQIRIYDDSPLFREVSRWIAKQGKASMKEVSVTMVRGVTPEVHVYSDSSERLAMTVGGHRVRVSTKRPTETDRPTDLLSMSIDEAKKSMRQCVTFTATTKQGQLAVLDLLEGIAKSSVDRKPQLMSMNKWGGWHEMNELRPRTPDTVILASGQWQELNEDLRLFLGAENEHVALGLPWHRGYLLYGPPGTGKTSTVRALATEFQMNVYVVSLSEVKGDSELHESFSSILPRSILLLEDVDVFSQATDRENQDEKLTMAGLLNALDGLVTPHGLVTVMTTNHRDKLDPALTRTGRVDLELELNPTDHHGAAALVTRFYSLDIPPSIPEGTYLQSDVVSALREHLRDPVSGIAAVSKKVRQHV